MQETERRQRVAKECEVEMERRKQDEELNEEWTKMNLEAVEDKVAR